MTAEQTLTAAKLAGWDVRKQPITSTDNFGNGPVTLTVPDTYAVWRTNPVTSKPQLLVNGTVGKVWDPFQNEEMTDFLDAVSYESGAGFETAGSLSDGQDVFVTMRLPEAIKVGGVDAMDLFLAAHNNHTGRKCLVLSVGAVRIVCKNTQDLHIASAKSTFKIRHTAGMRDGAVAEARKALALSMEYVDALQDEADRMINETFTDAQFEKFMIEMCGERPGDDATPKQVTAWEEEVGSLRWLFRESETQAAIRNTKWGAYQAAVEYLDWMAPVQARKGADPELVRARRTLSTDYANLKQGVYEILQAA
jgi:phage/plasmid-like protein (TIGR03299 family)